MHDTGGKAHKGWNSFIYHTDLWHLSWQLSVSSIYVDQHLRQMGSTVSKYLCNQLAEKCFSAGRQSSGRFHSTPGTGRQQLLHAA